MLTAILTFVVFTKEFTILLEYVDKPLALFILYCYLVVITTINTQIWRISFYIIHLFNTIKQNSIDIRLGSFTSMLGCPPHSIIKISINVYRNDIPSCAFWHSLTCYMHDILYIQHVT